MVQLIEQVRGRVGWAADSVVREYYWQVDFAQRGPLRMPIVDLRTFAR
jgi:hypothetical protein